MGAGFAEYLQARFPLDERSLNREVRALLVGRLRGRAELRCLDLGTGTGAMLRRLIGWELAGRLVLTGLDAQADLLDLARESAGALLRTRGFKVTDGGARCFAERAGQVVQVELRCARLAVFRPERGDFDLITAQAFMDVVPLEPTLRQVEGWLKPGGLFYATLNYDGETHLFPAYEDATFETRLLENYDQSMERRRVDGSPTGGRLSGTRLRVALGAGGFELLGCGPSHWDLAPVHGAYREQDAVCLEAILEGIRKEGLAAREFEPADLDPWFRDRSARLRSGRLGLFVRQQDLLAART